MAIINPYLKDFRTEIRTRFTEDSDAMTYSDWIRKNTRWKNAPFSFKGYEFQEQITNDMHKNLVVMKCSQIGLSEIQMRKFAAFLARNVAVSGIFTLPNDDMYRRLSTTRFAPMVNTEHAFNLSYGEKPIRRMDLYQINQSFGYFVGNKESDATSINADLLFHDEVDLSDQEMLGLFQSRLQGSDYKITQGFSTPTYEGFGVDSQFRSSDQHEYMVRCEHCNHYNIPEFNLTSVHIPGLSSDLNELTEIDADIINTLDLANAKVLCDHCRNPINLQDPSLREWVPRHAGRRVRGYRVSPFCTTRISLEYMVEQLVQYKQKDALRRFYNTVLGLPYNDSNSRLSELEIRAVMHGSSKPDLKGNPVVLGIDMGITCHLIIMSVANGLNVFEWRQVLATNLVDEIKTIINTYNVVGGCIDRNPYTPTAEEIRELTRGKIMPVDYSTSASAPAMVLKKNEVDELTHITVNRTQLIDNAVGLVRKRKIAFTGYGQYEGLIVQHLRDMVRIETPDAPPVWNKMNGNDHFFHALGYACFALRVNEALLYRSDLDPRIANPSSDLIVTMTSMPEVSMQRRRKEPTLLGALS